MKTRKRLSGFLVTLVIVFPLAAGALTNQEIAAQIQELTQLLASLQAQLAALQGIPTPINTSGCVVITLPLASGMRDISGGEITALQTFLRRTGDYTYPTITGYFGSVTQISLQRFQQKSGLPLSGIADAATRAAVQRTSCGTTVLPSPPPPVQTGSCFVGSQIVQNGSSVSMFSAPSVGNGSSCASYRQVRRCDNGILSGDTQYMYPSCTQPPVCTLDGEDVLSGASRVFYSKTRVDYGQSCGSYQQTRQCINGGLSGDPSYSHAECSARAAASCKVDGVRVDSGDSRTFYSTSTLGYGNSCSAFAQTRTCTNGVISGSDDFNYANCTAASAASCVVDGVTTLSGSTTMFYLAHNIPRNALCSQYAGERTCSNGTLSGNAAYRYASCVPLADTKSCVLDNIVLTTGTSRTFYSAGVAPAGHTCAYIAKTITCTNGALSVDSATFNRSTCTADAACVLDGVTVDSGASAVFFSARTVAYGKTCVSIGQTRACTNGSLSGTAATYKYGSCSVNPPLSLAPSLQQLASALAALEQAVKAFIAGITP